MSGWVAAGLLAMAVYAGITGDSGAGAGGADEPAAVAVVGAD
jgi:hypothetical protein